MQMQLNLNKAVFANARITPFWTTDAHTQDNNNKNLEQSFGFGN
jgi:hypothetical protein